MIKKWMNFALAAAKKAESHGDVPVGAIIVLNGKKIAVGMNRRELDQDPTGHAEIVAIRKAAKALGTWRLENCELIVTLEPCSMCLAAAQQSRIARIVYAATDPKGGAISLGYHLHNDKKLNHRFQVEKIDDERCGLILKEFFSKRRKEIRNSKAK